MTNVWYSSRKFMINFTAATLIYCSRKNGFIIWNIEFFNSNKRNNTVKMWERRDRQREKKGAWNAKIMRKKKRKKMKRTKKLTTERLKALQKLIERMYFFTFCSIRLAVPVYLHLKHRTLPLILFIGIVIVYRSV